MESFRLASEEDYLMLKSWYEEQNDHAFVPEVTGKETYIFSLGEKDSSACSILQGENGIVAITGWLMVNPEVVESVARAYAITKIITYLEELAKLRGAKIIMCFTDSYSVANRHANLGYHVSGKDYLRLFKWTGV